MRLNESFEELQQREVVLAREVVELLRHQCAVARDQYVSLGNVPMTVEADEGIRACNRVVQLLQMTEVSRWR